MEPTNSHRGHPERTSSIPPAVQNGTFVHNGEYWTVGYGAATFLLRDVLGLTYIHRLLQHPGEQFHVLDLLIGASDEVLAPGASEAARFSNGENFMVGRLGDSGPILDSQAKQDYRRRIVELREELSELRERGSVNPLSEKEYQKREEIESEIEVLTRQLAQAVGIFGRDRRSGSAAERARLNVTRAIRAAIQKIAERNALLGELLGAGIKTGSFCSYFPNPRAPLEWKLAPDGAAPATPAEAPALSFLQSDASFVQPMASRTKFVGREVERAILRRCLERTKTSAGRVVILAGPPGIGKTRTAREAGEEARGQDFVALAGNCYDREDAVPFVPFVEVFETMLTRATGPEAIGKIFGKQAAELTRLLPQLRRLLPDLPSPTPASPEQSRRLLFNAVLELFQQQSALSPIVLLLEDLQWADEGTLALLGHLGRSIAAMPVMIIATHRNDKIDMKPPLTKALDELNRSGIVERIALHGLPEEAVAQMIEVLSGHHPSPDLVDLIYSNTDGNPLFVEELVRHLEQSEAKGGLLERLEQGEAVLPHSLRLAIRRRLGLVTKDTVRVLGTAALIGRSFTFALLEAATQTDPERLLDAIEEAEKAGLISSKLQYPEARFKFAHELIRRAVLDEVSPARRQRLHLHIAQAFEALYGNATDEHAEDLAHHFWSAGDAADPAKAVGYLQMAGDKAVQSSANVGAIGHFRKALGLIARLPETPQRLQRELALLTNLGAALIATRGFSTRDVVEVYARAREVSQQVGEAAQFFRILWGQWVNCASRAEYDAALECGLECLRVAAGVNDPVLLVEAHHALGVGYGAAGEFDTALAHLEQAVTIYDPARHALHAYTYGQDPAALCLIHAGWNLWFLGYPDRARRRNEKGLAVARRFSHQGTIASAAAFAAWLEQFCRNPQAVAELASVAVDLSTQHEFAFIKGIGITLQGWALTQSEQQEAGLARMCSGLAVLRTTDAVTMMGYFSGLLAEAYAAAGQVEEGLQVLAGIDRTRERFWQAELYRLEGELLLRRCELEALPESPDARAETCFRQALTIARAQKAKSLELRVVLSLCRLWLRQGERPKARLALEEIFQWFTEGLNTPDLQDAKRLLEQLQGR